MDIKKVFTKIAKKYKIKKGEINMNFLVETKVISNEYGMWSNTMTSMCQDDIYDLIKKFFGDFEILMLKKSMAILKNEKDNITTIKVIYAI